MDLRKAFDTVPMRKLMQKLKLETYNFWINSGVMEGSKLGPILFIIFIHQ